MKKAFTLVELIVVITILAILWTISFISLQWYSAEARDSKRISDTSSLLTKVNIEQTKWEIPLEKLIVSTHTYSGQILWKANSPYESMWKVDFELLKENPENFKDPSTKADYPMAYAIWGTWTWAYKFIQILTRSEKENQAVIKWNYYTTSTWDIPSLFFEDWGFIENGKPYNPWTPVTPAPEWMPFCVFDDTSDAGKFDKCKFAWDN